MEHDDKIKLVLINGRAMTFNADDYIKLRKEHRIIGKLIGVAPPFPRNVNLLHLPAYYSDFETKLILEENIGIIEERNLSEPPNEAEKDAFKTYQNNVGEELQNLHIKSKLENAVINMQQIIKGKRKKLIKSGVPENEIKLNQEDILKEEEEKHRQAYNPQNLHSHISTEHPFHCQVKEVTDFPVQNMAKYRIFHDLWKKGFYITNAENFGADFLTYNGDPIYFHATQVVHIVDQNDLFEPHFIISCGRLSVSVKKKCLFAYIGSNNSIVYQTLEWDNPKLRELYDVDQDKNKSDLQEESM